MLGKVRVDHRSREDFVKLAAGAVITFFAVALAGRRGRHYDETALDKKEDAGTEASKEHEAD